MCALALRTWACLRKKQKERAVAALRQAGLKESIIKVLLFYLSGGQKRRVAIAGVLAMNPEVLILDEPTAGLDPKGRDDILEQIAYLHEERKITVILVSHSMEDIARYVDCILVMNQGQKAFDGTPKEVFAKYKELETIGLAAPQITYIMHDLYDAGLAVDTQAITIEEAKESILNVLGPNDDARYYHWTILSGRFHSASFGSQSEIYWNIFIFSILICGR